MPDDKAPHDRALDLFVYAPVGMALYVRDMLPMMMGVFVSRGKREVQAHVPGAAAAAPPSPAPSPADVRRKMEESFGIARGAAESGVGVAMGVAGTGVGVAKGVAGSGLGIARDVAGSALQGFTARRGPDDAGARPAPATSPRREAPASSPAPPPVTTAPAGSDNGDTAPGVETLPIPDYDELSASQVVERLDGLDRSSLDAIRRYESAHRGRNTILGKIAQLT